MRCTECSKSIRPIVAVDIDGTTADYHFSFFKFAAEWMGRPALTGLEWAQDYHGDRDIATHMGIDKRLYREIKLAYRQGGMKRSLNPMPGASELFCYLADQGIEIWITTTRPYLQFGNIDGDTREWLRRHDFPYDHILFDDHKYRRLSELVEPARVVAVLEDQCLDWYEANGAGLNPLLVRSRYNWQADNMPALCVEGLAGALQAVQYNLEQWRSKNGVTAD